MYTVLIQSKKTQESFLRFHPLLAASLEKREIGVCQWVPSGAALDTAVPELSELVRYKSAWRAVILRTEEDLESPTRGNNPYDFLEEKDRAGLTEEDGRIIDRSADLIRLTHLLGGVPAPDPAFESYAAPEHRSRAELEQGEAAPETEADRMAIQWVKIRPSENDEVRSRYEKERRIHTDWTQANEPRISPPQEILLVTALPCRVEDRALLRSHRAWYDSSLSDAERFAERNHYPHNCRFLIYPMNQTGAINRERDSFLFWSALTVLMLNPTDSATLQPRKLYRLGVKVDSGKLGDTLQLATDRLEQADRDLRAAMIREEKKKESENPRIPDYHIGVPVNFFPDGYGEQSREPMSFGLTTELPEELVRWIGHSEAALDELEDALHKTDRGLDRAAEHLRRHCQYRDHEVSLLSEYQQEDLKESLEKDYQDMLDRQEKLPDSATDIRAEAAEADHKVRNRIRSRVSGSQALRAALIPFLLLLAGFAFGLSTGDEAGYLTAAAAGSALLCLLALWIVLLVRRGELQRESGRFEELLLAIRLKLSGNAAIFADFLGSVASHIHGKSYLDVMNRQINTHDNEYYLKMRRLKAFELLLAKLRTWSTALGLGEEENKSELPELEEEHLHYSDERLFSLQRAGNGRAELNNSGVELVTPLPFVTGIELRREEIVDDE